MIEIFIAGLFLRLIRINQGFWLDEAIGAIASHNYSYKEIITVFLTHDNHPPLYYFLLKAWGNVFGFGDISLRIPNVIIGSLCIFLVYKLIKKQVPKLAIVVSIFVATSPFLIYYSQEVRMYMLTVFFSLVAIYSFFETLNPKYLKRYWLIFSVSIAGLMFTDYVPVFLLPVFPLFAIFIKKRDYSWWKYFSFSFLLLIILGILWIPTLLIQIHGGSTVLSVLPSWSSVAGGATLKQALLVWTKFLLGRISIQPQKLYVLLLALFSATAITGMCLSFKSNKVPFIKFVWLWLLVPLILCFIVSFIFPAFIYFRFTFVTPAFLILIADGLFKINSRNLKWLLVSTMLLGNTIGCFVYFTQVTQQREQWREAVSFVESNASSGSVSLFEFPDAFAPYHWYERGVLPGIGALSSIHVQPGDDEKLIKKLLNVKTVYYFNYLQDLTDPENLVIKTLTSDGFKIKKQIGDYQGVGIITIWQKK